MAKAFGGCNPVLPALCQLTVNLASIGKRTLARDGATIPAYLGIKPLFYTLFTTFSERFIGLFQVIMYR